MKKLGLNEIRQKFLEFYVSKEHYAGKSSSLIPHNDKSLLLINSGMAPLKNYFAGIEEPPAKRMTTCQKCIRTGDIENVGQTARHGTFFEMLGNFSFGDYFKEQSLEWGLEFMTTVLEMPFEKIWATVYQDDDEAVEIWKKLGMPEERIVRLGKDDNFWEIGLGPCGPCSELYFDRGPEYGCGSPDCKPGCDCDRYLEFWNHVFTQFSREEDGSYSNLEHPNIDTGMGLERIACIMQGVDSIFDIDTIKYILDSVVAASGVEYHDGQAKTDVSIRIITDHLRSMTFMIGDGILPGNEGRGYVLRRIIRRAARQGKVLGIEGAFLSKLCDKVIDMSGKAYPELEERRVMIKKVIAVEEEKFASTIDQGMKIIEGYIEELKAAGSTVLDGEKAFKLHDTYGFPIDLTREILEESGYSVDKEGFEKAMLEQKTRSQANQGMEDAGWDEAHGGIELEGATVFTGYEKVVDTGVVMAILGESGEVKSVQDGDVCKLVFDKTPFYAASGGQAADIGLVYNDNFAAEVMDVTKTKNIFIHKVKVVKGQLTAGEELTMMIHAPTRNKAAANHTATHLLHKALRETLGEHVKQAGSSVTKDSLRFDFNHFQGMTAEEIEAVENIVNDKISHFLDVVTKEMTPEEAVKEGATALFGEKYGDIVRVVSVGDYSVELCGGTHVKNSGQIGAFKIISETGVASGVRRIEAVTGLGVLAEAKKYETEVIEAAEAMKCNKTAVVERVKTLVEETKTLKKEVDELKKAAMGSGVDQMVADAPEFNGVKLITKEFTDCNINDLRNLSDDIKAAHKGVAMVFAAVNGEKVTFMVSLTDDVVEKGYHAGKMIKEVAAACGGGGGGKADMAQAGAKDASKINEAFAVAEKLLS